jgi:predicted peptidase
MVDAMEERPGIHRLVWQKHHQRYGLYIPPLYSPERPRSLILALHFGGPAYAYRGEALLTSLVVPALEELGVLILAPDCTQSAWDNPLSERDTVALLDHVQSRHQVQNKAIIMGYSMGGMGAWYLAARNQELLAGVMPISARPQPDSASVDWRIPLYAIHSRDDELFPLGPTVEVVNRLQANKANVRLTVLDGIGHFEVSRFIGPLNAAGSWFREVWAE